MPTTTEIKMTEAGCLRDTYFVPQLSLPPYSNLTNLDWTEMRNKTLARGNATRETKRTTHNNSKSAIPQTKQHNVWEYSDNWQDDSRVVVLKTHTVGWGVEEDTQTHRERLTETHSCNRTCKPFWHVLIEHRCESKHCKRVPKTRKKQKCGKNVWELIGRDSSYGLVVILKYTTTEGV